MQGKKQKNRCHERKNRKFEIELQRNGINGCKQQLLKRY